MLFRQTGLFTFFLSFIFLLLGYSPAAAHSVKVFAFEEGGRIYGEGYFADGTRVRESKVEVFDREGRKLLETQTDGNGAFAFPAPGERNVVVVLNASMGHRAEFALSLDAVKPAGIDDREIEGPAANSGAPGEAAPVAVISEERIRALMNEVLDDRMKPLVKAVLAAKRDNPSFVIIIGGIGYIVGVFGVVLFWKVQREKRNHDR